MFFPLHKTRSHHAGTRHFSLNAEGRIDVKAHMLIQLENIEINKAINKAVFRIISAGERSKRILAQQCIIWAMSREKHVVTRTNKAFFH